MRKVRHIHAVPDARHKYAEPFIPKLLAALTEEDNKTPLSDAMVFVVLEQSGVLERIRTFKVIHQMQDNPDSLTPQEQFDEQKRDLYKRAMAGDTQAKKLWFELHSLLDQGMDFNVQVKVTPYRVQDESLKSIVAQADKDVVREILSGLHLRLKVDEAPHFLVENLERWMEFFEEWAKAAYGPKVA